MKYHITQLTAYEKLGYIDFEDYLKDIIKEQLEEAEFHELLNVYNEYCANNQYEEYFSNDEDFFQTFFGTIIEGVRATQYGDYRYYDDYVQFNGYGNIDSYSLDQVEQEIKTDNSFIQYLLDCYEDYHFIDIDNLIEHKEELLKESYKLIKQGY